MAATSSSVATIAISPIPASSAFDSLLGSVGRTAAGVAWPLMPHGVKGKNFLRHVAQDPRGRYLDSIRLFQPDEMQALLSPELGEAIDRDRQHRFIGGSIRGAGALPWASQMMRFDMDTYLPGRHPHEGRSDEHGALDRVARAAARPRGRGVRGLASPRT